MDCNRTRELLSEYVDDALSGEEKVRLEEHLAGCPACAEELESLRRIVEGVRGLGKVAAPDDLFRDVMRGIEPAAPEPPRATDFRWIIPLAAAAVILITMTTLFFIAEDERSLPYTGPELLADLDGDAMLEKEEAPHGLVDGFATGDGFAPRDKGEDLRRLGREDGRKGMRASRGRSEVMDEIEAPSEEAEEGQESAGEAAAGSEAAKSKEYLKKTAPRRPEAESKSGRVQPPGDARGVGDAPVTKGGGVGGKGQEEGPGGPAAAAPATGAAAGATAAKELHTEYNVLVVETDRDWENQAASLNASRVPLKKDAPGFMAGYGRSEAEPAPLVALFEINVSDIDGLVRGLADSGAAAVHAYAVPETDATIVGATLVQNATTEKIADEEARAPVTLWSRSGPSNEQLESLRSLGYTVEPVRDELAGIVRESLAAIDREKRDVAKTIQDDVPDEKGVRDESTRTAKRRKDAVESDLERVREEPAAPPRRLLLLFVRKAQTPAATKPR